MSERQRGLGRGLSALLGEPVAETASVGGGALPGGVQMAPIESLKPNPDQPRKIFTKADLEELTGSIRDKGILQPILVRAQPGQDGMWQIIAGERRWRAALVLLCLYASGLTSNPLHNGDGLLVFGLLTGLCAGIHARVRAQNALIR